MATLIGGGIIGFLSATGKDWFLENKKNKIKQEEFKRRKLEDIFVIMTQLFDKMLDPILKHDGDIESAKISLLIRFYFPHLTSDYQKFLEDYVKIKFMKIQNELSGKQAIMSEETLKEATKKHKDFLTKLVEESHKLQV